MSVSHRRITQSTTSTNLADLLERVLDKGVVIAGDIKVKIVDIELLTIQLRLVICSVDKAREMGIDWWKSNPEFAGPTQSEPLLEAIEALHKRLDKLEDAQTREQNTVPQFSNRDELS